MHFLTMILFKWTEINVNDILWSSGAVPMSATWYKDDVPIPNCEDFAYVDGKNGEFGLLIVDPFSADSGIYSCKVINTFGEAISHGQLVINGLYNTYIQVIFTSARIIYLRRGNPSLFLKYLILLYYLMFIVSQDQNVLL